MHELYELEDGTWLGLDEAGAVRMQQAHAPEDCEHLLCDAHGRRGLEPYNRWRLFWGTLPDRVNMPTQMYMQCPHKVLHPTAAQVMYLEEWLLAQEDNPFARTHYVKSIGHDCDGCCAGAW